MTWLRSPCGRRASTAFALGGGNALIAHGIINRPTEDVDLFTNEDNGVQAAAGAVGDALRAAGYEAERRERPAASPTSSTAWAMGWRNGSSPPRTARR